MSTKVEVLISTMDKNDLEFFKRMNIHTDAIIINQNQEKDSTIIYTINGYQMKWVNSTEKGLSNSRNLAISHATADLCVLADDDMVFESDAFIKVEKAYEENPDADLIAFKMDITGNPERAKKYGRKKKWQNYFTSMAIMSGEISFKREKIVKNNLSFNPNQGTGTDFYHGEENVFLYDCLRAGLNILYMPVTTVQVDFSVSSWYEGYTDRYFHTTGVKCYNMSNKFYPLLYMKYAWEHYQGYKDELSLIKAIKLMHKGTNIYKREYESHSDKVQTKKEKQQVIYPEKRNSSQIEEKNR